MAETGAYESIRTGILEPWGTEPERNHLEIDPRIGTESVTGYETNLQSFFAPGGLAFEPVYRPPYRLNPLRSQSHFAFKISLHARFVGPCSAFAQVPLSKSAFSTLFWTAASSDSSSANKKSSPFGVWLPRCCAKRLTIWKCVRRNTSKATAKHRLASSAMRNCPDSLALISWMAIWIAASISVLENSQSIPKGIHGLSSFFEPIPLGCSGATTSSAHLEEGLR